MFKELTEGGQRKERVNSPETVHLRGQNKRVVGRPGRTADSSW